MENILGASLRVTAKLMSTDGFLAFLIALRPIPVLTFIAHAK
jgi:hypothetical protein